MLRLFTLGRFELARTGVTGDEMRRVSVQPKRLALLTYLAAAHPGVAHRRDSLLALFWPELPADEARRALRQSLHHLRRALGDQAVLSTQGEQIVLNEALWCDALAIQVHVQRGEDAQALALYGGDFLDGVFFSDVAPEFEEWLARMRGRLRELAATAAWRQSERLERSGDITAAVAAGQRARDLAPEDERILRYLMELHVRAGDGARALRTFDEFQRHMTDAFGARPSAATLDLVGKLRAGLPGPMTARSVSGATNPDPATVPLPARQNVSPEPIPRPRRARWRLPVVVSGLVLLLSAMAVSLGRGRESVIDPPMPPLAPQRVLVADLGNEADDQVLVRALSEALRIDLAQSPGVRVLSPQEIADALRLAGQPPDRFVDDSLVRVIAAREGVKAIISGDVARVGDRYVLTVRLVAAPDGEMVGAVRETADSASLVDAVGRASRKLRQQLGETLRSIRASPTLSRVTTPSLPALRAYSEAMRAIEETGDRGEAIRLLEQAIAIDSTFAAAFRMLGSLYASEGVPGKSASALETAFAHRERLPLRERYLTMGSYYRTVTGEHDKAIAAYLSLLELYPSDIGGLNNLALVYSHTRQFARAESLYRLVIERDTTIGQVYLALAQSLMNQGRFTESRRILDDVRLRFPDHPITPLTETHLAAAQRDFAAAERHIRVRLGRAIARGRVLEELDAHQTLGQILMAVGRLREGDEALQSAMAIAEREGAPRRYLFSAVQRGWLDARHRGRTQRGIEIVESALARFPLASLQVEDRPYSDLVTFFAGVGRGSRAREIAAAYAQDLELRDATSAPATHMIAAHLAILDGRPAGAVAELRRAEALDRCPVCVLPTLGEALELSGDAEGAIAVYERYLRTPWQWRFESDATHLAYVLGRLGALYEGAGRRAEATARYEEILRLWSSGDVEHEGPRALARARLAAMARSTR